MLLRPRRDLHQVLDSLYQQPAKFRFRSAKRWSRKHYFDEKTQCIGFLRYERNKSKDTIPTFKMLVHKPTSFCANCSLSSSVSCCRFTCVIIISMLTLCSFLKTKDTLILQLLADIGSWEFENIFSKFYQNWPSNRLSLWNGKLTESSFCQLFTKQVVCVLERKNWKTKARSVCLPLTCYLTVAPRQNWWKGYFRYWHGSLQALPWYVQE